jgi:hypothetical protein
MLPHEVTSHSTTSVYAEAIDRSRKRRLCPGCSHCTSCRWKDIIVFHAVYVTPHSARSLLACFNVTGLVNRLVCMYFPNAAHSVCPCQRVLLTWMHLFPSNCDVPLYTCLLPPIWIPTLVFHRCNPSISVTKAVHEINIGILPISIIQRFSTCGPQADLN